jgi:hypothetical protein
VEANLALFHRTLIEDFGWDGLGRKIDALGLGLFQNSGEKPHLELEGQDVGAGGLTLAAFHDDFFDKKTTNRKIDRPDDDKTPGILAMEKGVAFQGLGFVGPEDNRS